MPLRHLVAGTALVLAAGCGGSSERTDARPLPSEATSSSPEVASPSPSSTGGGATPAPTPSLRSTPSPNASRSSAPRPSRTFTPSPSVVRSSVPPRPPATPTRSPVPSPRPTLTPSGETHPIEMTPGNTFVPASLTIEAGDAVRVRNSDRIDHDFTDQRTFNSGNMPPGATYTYRFNRTGRYDYVCTYHSGMTGTITVR